MTLPGSVSAVLSLFLAGALLFAQTPKRFDVVSIRPSPPDADTDTRRLPHGTIIATGLTVKGLIRRAWDVQDFQILGGPPWASTDRYSISAHAPEDTPADEPLNPFIQTMLADRFGLRVHHENRRFSRLALTVGRNGYKLRASQPGSRTTWTIRRGFMIGQNVTIGMLAINMLQRALGQWVSDETGISGQFDITLQWTLDDDLTANPASDLSIFTAIQEQLGLKLVASKGPVPVIVIDSLHRPTEN